jgi:hypothetical protein
MILIDAGNLQTYRIQGRVRAVHDEAPPAATQAKPKHRPRMASDICAIMTGRGGKVVQ